MALVLQSATHWPSAHTLFCPHSLEYLQRFDVAVQSQPEQDSLLAQSADDAQAHGPLVPPHAWHLPPMHCELGPQSFFVVHSTGVGLVLGAAQMPLVQTVPLGHSASTLHCTEQPLLVQTCPEGQLELPVHAWLDGGFTVVQP